MSESETEYAGIDIAEFESGKPMPYDVYVRLTDNKYVKVTTAEAPLTPDRLKGYKDKQVTHLFITQADFAKLLGLSGPRADHLTPEQEAVFREMKTDTEATLDLLHSNELNEFLFESGVSAVNNVVAMAATNNSLLAMLNAMKEAGSNNILYQHGVAVSLFSAMIAQAMGWTSAAKIHVLSLGALMHDIGEKDTGIKNPGRAPALLAGLELTKNQAHTRLGAEMLAKVGTVPSDVTDIVMQHHENCLGTGYPGKLPKLRIHPMARIVAVAEAFCELTLPEPGGPSLNPGDAIRDLLVTDELDHDVVKALTKLYMTGQPPTTPQEPTPKENPT